MRKIPNAPEHLALIPDGNRRWAKKHGLRLQTVYLKGINKFIDFSKWSKEFGIKTITVWALSTENLSNRTALELKVLFYLYTKAAKDKKILQMLKDNGARLRVVGDLSTLPNKLKDALYTLERETARYQECTINMLINYGGKEDLMYSMAKLKSAGAKNINDKMVRENLRTASLPDVDLVLRTSGEQRVSGLLPWQAAYSELYFAKKYWPDFSRADLRRAIVSYAKRQRRFGK